MCVCVCLYMTLSSYIIQINIHTLRQQQNTFQQKLKLNIESHGKP